MIKKEHVEVIAADRLKICKSNVCGYYDPKGEAEVTVFKGVESCGACGCRLDLKTRSLSSNCGLETINKTPLWVAVMTEGDEDLLKIQLDKDEI